MLFNINPKYIRLFAIASLVVIFDQITKFIILGNLAMYETICVIPNFFNIVHVHNTGGAFGIFADSNIILRKILFLFIASVATVFVFYLYNKVPIGYKYLSLGFALVFGGAIGNIIDRVRMGEVVDFLDFYIGSYHWPAFNIADSAISIGITIFVIHVIFNKIPEI